MAESFYNKEKFQRQSGVRQLKLNDLAQEFPKGRLKIVDRKKQQALNDPNKTYPILTLEDETKTRYEVMAFERDVLECAQEWGDATDPLDYGYVIIRKAATNTRMQIVPAEDQLEPEEIVVETKRAKR